MRAKKLENFQVALAEALVLVRRYKSLELEFDYAKNDAAVANLMRSAAVVEMYSPEVGRLGTECAERFEWWSAHAGPLLNAGDDWSEERAEEEAAIAQELELTAERAKKAARSQLGID